jgi:hypothetical protein
MTPLTPQARASSVPLQKPAASPSLADEKPKKAKKRKSTDDTADDTQAVGKKKALGKENQRAPAKPTISALTRRRLKVIEIRDLV